MKRTSVALAAMLLAGCASPAYQAFRSGDTLNGCRLLLQQGARNAEDMNNIGYCYDHGLAVERNRDTAVRFWTVAARHGHRTAMANLAAVGAPVPAADLAPAGVDPAGLAVGAQLLQAGQPRALVPSPTIPQRTNCFSSLHGTNVITTCQ